MTENMPPMRPVHDNAPESRFEITIDGRLAGFVDYRRDGDEYALPHTRVAVTVTRGTTPGQEPRESPAVPCRPALSPDGAHGGVYCWC